MIGSQALWIAALLLLATVPAAHSATLAARTTPERQVRSFDPDWRFYKGDAPGAEQPAFDDTAWRTLDVPHDWSIEGPFDQNNPTGGAGAFLPAGVGWYRKRFALPAALSGRRLFIEFDGVMANSDIWINGTLLGHRPNGYVGLRYELTDRLHFGDGAPNVLAVRADNAEQPASRWYAGAGIYRHVRLEIADPVHLAPQSVFVTTPQITDDSATVRLESAVVNQSATPRRVALKVTLQTPDGALLPALQTPSQTIAAGGSADFHPEMTVPKPQRWDIDHPVLYRAVTTVLVDGKAVDSETTPFGIRTFRFDAATGFSLNGRNLKIQGVCLHSEAGALGAAVPLRAWERRLSALKGLGVNAIRTAHNPVAPEFLDLCDRMGFLVMDELFDCWTVAKNPYDYHLYFKQWAVPDIRDTVQRDRNHPSIILYSAGNEIRDTPNAAAAKETMASLIAAFHAADPTRPVTQALFRPNASHDYDDGLADMLDVVGQNYREPELLAAHQAKPERRIIGTETSHDRTAWRAMRDNPAFAGQFLWTGIDYLGESRAWPVIGAGSGLLDRTGATKPLGYQRQSWWSAAPMVHAVRRVAPTAATPSDPGFNPLRRPQTTFADWTPSNQEPHDETVEVYSNCEQVTLTLNGQPVGAPQPRPADDSPRTWTVPFAPGALQAEGSNGGKTVATVTLQTAGKPAKLLLTADRDRLTPTWDDVSYVTATVVDANGIPIPGGEAPVTFTVTGPGVIVAVDNGDNASHEPFIGSSRKAFQGRCVAIVRATAGTGAITVSASAEELASGAVGITVGR